MPYIPNKDRSFFDDSLTDLYDLKPGELNYCITRLLLLQAPECYADYNKLIGVLESCKLEFYRLAVAKYEDEKIAENGDVYGR